MFFYVFIVDSMFFTYQESPKVDWEPKPLVIKLLWSQLPVSVQVEDSCGTCRKGMGAPANVQSSFLPFPGSTKLAKTFNTIFAVDVVVVLVVFCLLLWVTYATTPVSPLIGWCSFHFTPTRLDVKHCRYPVGVCKSPSRCREATD